jgi:hypothetical protein
MDKTAMISTLVLSVLGVYFIQAMLGTMYIMAEYSWPLSRAFSFSFTYVLDNIAEVTADSLTEFLFFGLGIFIAWNDHPRTNDDEVQQIEAVKNTVTPYPRMAATHKIKKGGADAPPFYIPGIPFHLCP